MNHEEMIRHFKNILIGSVSGQDTKNFTQMLMQIATEGYGENKPNPIYEALETLDCFLEELDETCGLAILKYGRESHNAMELLHSWYDEQIDKDDIIEYLLDMLEEEHIGMRAVAIEEIKNKFGVVL